MSQKFDSHVKINKLQMLLRQIAEICRNIHYFYNNLVELSVRTIQLLPRVGSILQKISVLRAHP